MNDEPLTDFIDIIVNRKDSFLCGHFILSIKLYSYLRKFRNGESGDLDDLGDSINRITRKMRSKVKGGITEKTRIIIPILSYTKGILDYNKKKYTTEFNFLAGAASKHWTLCVIYPYTKTVEYYDSLNYTSHFKFWKKAMEIWMNTKDFVTQFQIDSGAPFTHKRFEKNTCHQYASLDCGYFACLYTELLSEGLTMDRIESSSFCTQSYIKKQYKPYIRKLIKHHRDKKSGNGGIINLDL